MLEKARRSRLYWCFIKEMDMIKVEKSVLIQKPVEEVFNFVTAEGNYTGSRRL